LTSRIAGRIFTRRAGFPTGSADRSGRLGTERQCSPVETTHAGGEDRSRTIRTSSSARTRTVIST
jgi:hypothetical protein